MIPFHALRQFARPRTGSAVVYELLLLRHGAYMCNDAVHRITLELSEVDQCRYQTAQHVARTSTPTRALADSRAQAQAPRLWAIPPSSRCAGHLFHHHRCCVTHSLEMEVETWEMRRHRSVSAVCAETLFFFLFFFSFNHRLPASIIP